jgi:hypothetical protein
MSLPKNWKETCLKCKFLLIKDSTRYFKVIKDDLFCTKIKFRNGTMRADTARSSHPSTGETNRCGKKAKYFEAKE